jgi:hypothetical protein
VIDGDGLDAGPRSSGGSSWRKKALAGLLALLLVGTIAGSLVGGTRDTGAEDGTTTSGPPASTSTTADRAALVDAGVALVAALTPVPGGDVTGAADQNAPEAALVDLMATGWYDRPDGTHLVFVRTRGGPPPDFAGCYQLAVTFTGAAGVVAEGEINVGGPCAVVGASEKGRMAGFLLPEGALWILDLDTVASGEPVVAGVLAAQLLVEGATPLVDTTAVPLAAPPVSPEIAEAVLPLANFRPANPPDS